MSSTYGSSSSTHNDPLLKIRALQNELNLANEPKNILVNPTFLLKRVKYDTILENYKNNKYKDLTFNTNSYRELNSNSITAYLGTNIELNDNPVGFSILVGETLIKVVGRNQSYGICAHCNLNFKGFCSFGLPYKIVNCRIKPELKKQYPYSSMVMVFVTGETCSTECTYSYFLKLGTYRINLDPKYLDTETMIKFLHGMLFCKENNGKLLPADPITTLIPFGETTVNAYRKKLSMIPESSNLRL